MKLAQYAPGEAAQMESNIIGEIRRSTPLSGQDKKKAIALRRLKVCKVLRGGPMRVRDIHAHFPNEHFKTVCKDLAFLKDANFVTLNKAGNRSEWRLT